MKPDPTIWDWPLRLWHWALAGFIVFSLYSGLVCDIGLLEWRQRSGLVLLGLPLGAVAIQIGAISAKSAMASAWVAKWSMWVTSPRTVCSWLLLAKVGIV